MKFIIIYITYPSLREAKKVTEALLKERLIACANYFPVESVYRWNDKIRNTKEVVSIVKTRKANWEKVKKAVTAMHSYETPCILKFEAEANKAFADWIEKGTE